MSDTVHARASVHRRAPAAPPKWRATRPPGRATERLAPERLDPEWAAGRRTWSLREGPDTPSRTRGADAAPAEAGPNIGLQRDRAARPGRERPQQGSPPRTPGVRSPELPSPRPRTSRPWCCSAPLQSPRLSAASGRRRAGLLFLPRQKDRFLKSGPAVLGFVVVVVFFFFLSFRRGGSGASLLARRPSQTPSPRLRAGFRTPGESGGTEAVAVHRGLP